MGEIIIGNNFVPKIAKNIVGDLAKMGLLIAAGIEPILLGELVNSIAKDIVIKFHNNTLLDLTLNLVSLYDSLFGFAEAINSTLSYNKEIINYCACQTGYNVMIKLKDGSIHNMKSICDMLE